MLHRVLELAGLTMRVLGPLLIGWMNPKSKYRYLEAMPKQLIGVTRSVNIKFVIKAVMYHLQPLVHKLPSFVKDTNDFLNKLLTIGNLSANSLLVTLDVSSLYTNIPHNEGTNACERFLRTSSHKTIPTSTLCDLIRMILTMNNFSFNDNHYLQIHGTAMGTKMAPSYANLFLGFFEANALKNAPFQPTLGCAISMIFL